MVSTFKTVAAFFLLVLVSTLSSAAVLEVGQGKPYATIQNAVNVAADGDEIIIYAGTYAETVTIANLNNLYIHANGTDRVTVKGGFNLYNASSATWSDNNLIEGLYFDKTGSTSGWAVQHQYARSNTYKDCVFFGDGSGANGIYGNLEYGLNIARHCTFVGLAVPYSHGWASGLHVFDSIVAFNGAQSYNYTDYNGVATYSCFYNNPVTPGLPDNVGTTEGSIYVDPMFVTLDPFSENFLLLQASSPCIGTASDSSNMGATPRAPSYNELTVGSGEEYATIQAAVNDAAGGDIVTVFEGVYEENVTINQTKSGLMVRVNPGDTVVLVGTFNLIGTSSPLIENVVIDGFYIDKRNKPENSWAIYGTYARNNTFKNCVIFADGGGTGGSGIYGGLGYGLNTASHCTIVGTRYPYSSDSASGLHVYDSIVAFNDAGAYNYHSGVVLYSDFYQNGLGAGLPGNIGSTTGTISQDPLFVSSTIGCGNYLWLNQTVSPCVGTATGGTNMGALPATTSVDCVEDPNAVDDPVWTMMYLGNAWPTDNTPEGPWGGYGTPVAAPEWQMFNYYGYGEPMNYPGNSFFRMRTSPGGYLYYRKSDAVIDPNCPDLNFDFSVGATVETRLKLYADGAYYSDGGLGLSIFDGSSYAAVNWLGNPGDPSTYRIRLQGGNGTVETAEVDTTEWHTYRLVIKDGYAALFLDGNAMPILTNTTASGTSDFGYVQWGDLSSSAAGYAYWDYVKVYTGGAVPGIPILLSSEPANGETLCRGQNNVIRIVTGATIASLPETPLKIIKTGTQTDVTADFSYSLATTTLPNDTLVATENGKVLEDLTWYHVESANGWISPFRFDFVVVAGDVDNDYRTDLADFGLLAGQWFDTVPGNSRVDLNGDGSIGPVDLAVMGSGWLNAGPANPWIAVTITEYSGNPVLVAGSEPVGAATIGVLHTCVRKKDASSPYMMWYSGDVSGSTRRIYLATSNDGIAWTKYGQVLSESSAHAMMPSVLWDSSAGQWKMWYTSGSPYAIYYATSWDGQTWNKYPGNPVFQVPADPCAWDATSVRSPAVIYDAQASLYKMWYWGNNDSSAPGTYGEFGTGLATSPDGIIWTRVGQISDESTLITNDVIQLNGVYYSFHNIGPHLGYAVSLDGISWDQDPANPLIYAGGTGWKKSYIQAPSIVYDAGAGELHVYFNGGDYSLPADGTTIGFATTPFNP